MAALTSSAPTGLVLVGVLGRGAAPGKRSTHRATPICASATSIATWRTDVFVVRDGAVVLLVRRSIALDLVRANAWALVNELVIGKFTGSFDEIAYQTGTQRRVMRGGTQPRPYRRQRRNLT